MGKGKYEDWVTPEGLAKIEGWAREGLTDKQIAGNIGVSEKSFNDWKTRFPSLSSALKKGKAPVDLAVENALYKSATGYTKTLRKPVKLRQRGGVEVIEYVDEEFYYPPQVTAQIFWLKNRRRDRWKDKPEESGANEQISEILQSIYDMKKRKKDDNVERKAD